jgi:PKD repeat protein
MKALLTTLIILLSFASYSQSWLEKMQSSGNVFEAKSEFEAYWQNKTPEKGEGYKQFMRWYNFWESRTFPTGDIVGLNSGVGIQEHLDLQESKSFLKSSTSTWSPVGPYTTSSGYNGIGRINTIEFHPTDPDTWFVGTPGGGLWKTTDAGASWSPLTDFLTNLGISDVAISSSNPNIIYIATGDRDARDTYSFGVLKSTDGGTTWNNTGLTSTVQNGWTTNRILINPSNENIVLVATGDGIYRSTDAGATFSHVQTSGHFITMEFNPADPNVVYAGEFDYWNEQARFYKSTNNGQSWTQVTNGLPTADCRRMHIGVSQANASYVYLITVDNVNGMEGFYRSSNAGSSFSLMSSSPNVLESGDGTGTGGQGWYDLSLAVSQTNAEEVYVGGVNMWKSSNGGSNFFKMTHWYNDGSTVIHADQHWFTFHNNDLFVCNDGGLYVSSDGANSFVDRTNGLNITQYYRISNDQNTNDKLIAGAQDNGSDVLNGGIWNDVTGGDGMHCLIDHTDPNIVFSSSQYGTIYRSSDGGVNFTDVSPSAGNGAWITPYEMDPTDNNVMYCGYDDIYKSFDNGVNWTQITSGLSNESLRHIQISESNSNVVYCATYEKLYKSIDSGNTFTDVTGSLPVGNASISSICIDPLDQNRVWVTFSGYSSGEKVFRTDNGSASWTNQSGSLPNLPANILVYQEGANGLLYVGTDVGVYYWSPQTLTWDIYGTDLPNVIVNDLDIQYGQGVIRAATYGRGVWEIPLQPTAPPTADFTAPITGVCEGATINFDNLSLQGATYSWIFNGGTPSTSTAENPVIQYDIAGLYDVQLIAYNQTSSDTLVLQNYIQVEGNQINTTNLANSANVYTNVRNNTQPIAVNNDLNTILFVHRQNTNEHSGTSGMLRYDYSTDNGQSWTLDNGVLNPSATAGTNDSRYPEVAIYNPSGNTDPSNASLVYQAPTVGSTWAGYVSGDGVIGSGSYSENYNQGSPSNTLIPGGMTEGAPGEFWSVDAEYDGIFYSGLKLLKGTWGGSSVDWVVKEVFTPSFNTDINGTPSLAGSSFDIAFDPTGQNGWVVFLSHLNGTISNYQYYPIFYQTTDGGTTWSGPIEVDLSSFPNITSNITGGGVASSAFDINLTVDAAGNPHTIFTVCSGDNTNYSVLPSEWMGACHLHHNGTSWEADVLQDIETLNYALPDGSFMHNTPQISVNDQGNIVALSWTDSDPSLTGGQNSLPFLNIVAYNTNTGVHSAVETADICNVDPGKIKFLHCANNLLETTLGYEVAAVISDLNVSGSGLDETGHKFFTFPVPNVCSASADITSVSSICVGENVLFEDNSINTTGNTYQWDIDNNDTVDYSTIGDISHSYNSPGIKTVNLVLNDGNGCLSASTIDITVDSLPNIDIDFPSFSCGLDQISYVDNSSLVLPATYEWDFDGDGNQDAATSGSQAYNPPSFGMLNGTVTVTDGNGCLNTLNLPIQVDPEPVADFDLPNEGCVGDVISILDNSQNGVSYLWDIDNNGVSDYAIAGDILHTYTSPGLYTVQLDIENGNCLDNHSSQINIEDEPVADFNVVHQGGTSYLFQDLSTGGGSYQWNFGDGSTSNVAGNVSHTYSDGNAYSVTLIVTNNCGNDSGLGDVTSTVSLSDNDKSLRVFPNPTSGEFTIELNGYNGSSYVLTDNLGRLIQKGSLNNQTTVLDLAPYSSGLYYLELNAEKESVVKKIELRK